MNICILALDMLMADAESIRKSAEKIQAGNAQAGAAGYREEIKELQTKFL